MPASTLHRTVSIWASLPAPALSLSLSLHLVVPALLCHVFHLPHTSNIHFASPRRCPLNFFPASLFCSYPFSPTILLAAFFSPHLRRILFSSSFSRCDPPSLPRCPNIPFHRPSPRCRTGTRNSSLQTHDSTTPALDYASSRYCEHLYNLGTTTDFYVYVCARGTFRAGGVVRSLRAMR